MQRKYCVFSKACRIADSYTIGMRNSTVTLSQEQGRRCNRRQEGSKMQWHHPSKEPSGWIENGIQALEEVETLFEEELRLALAL